MALTIQELYDNTREKYNLTLLSGHNALDYVLTWVHMIEDTTVAEFFWGNEMVVTGGYAAHTEEQLLQMIDVLMEHRCAGLVINVGMYVLEVPPAVVEYCNRHNFPLMTMPWNMSMTEFVRECCSLINKSTRDEEAMAAAVIHAIRSPNDAGSVRPQLEDLFHEEDGFRILAIWTRLSGAERNVMTQRSTLRLHTAMHPYNFPYLVFRHERSFLVLLNRTDPVVADEIAGRILELVHTALPQLPIYIGISDPAASLEQLSDCFHQAFSAQRRAALQQIEIVRFRDMGFYKLLYSVPDDALLTGYFHEMMDPLLNFDARHNSNYVETLCRYLLLDGSLQRVAQDMFTHRNTVNYRMGKIREILDCPLETQSQRLPYLIAYHAAVIMKQLPDYEAEG